MTNSTSNRHGDAPFRFAVSATFTANPIEPVISFWGGHLKSDFDVRFAPYNQLVQTLLDPGGEFATNTHGVNIMLLRIEDLAQSASSVNGCGTAKLESNAQHLAQQVRSTAARFAVPLIVCVCPSASLPPQIEHAVGATLAACLVDIAGVQYLTHETIASWYPVEVVHDAEGDRLGAIPYTELYYCALATALVRLTHDLLMPPFKVVAVDCDNTLWSGICGEDGPENVRIEGPHRILQQFVLEQHDSGMLLTMASKNNEGDVLETFRVHPEMPLALRHFAGWRLNWERKAENLVQLSEQLSLGLDSFIFIDDNPKECAEIKEALPEVLTITLPESAGEAEQLLRHVWAFDRLVLTEEDRNRNAYYSQAQEFGTELRQASNLEQFMASLELHVSIAPVSPDRLPRVAQLTQRTNQFNLTTLRRSELDLKSLMARGHEVFTVEVTDRFGDYGVVGVLIVRTNQDVLHVDTMLLSCRALGRGVEHRMASFLGQHADSCGIHSVDFRFDRTDKNVPARQFLEQIEPGSYLPDELGFTLKIPAAKLVDLRWRPTSAGPIEPTPASQPRAARTPRQVDYEYIARRLSKPGDILAAMRRVSTKLIPTEAMSGVEQQLAHIWAELLAKQTVARLDNFFDLGGHSLTAVLLLLRIKEVFEVELSIDDVYSGTLTLADLAARIEAAKFGRIDPAEYAALLAEIEGMSDEEARELLEREDAERV